MTQDRDHKTNANKARTGSWWRAAIRQPVFWIVLVLAVATGFVLGGGPGGAPTGPTGATDNGGQATTWTCSMHPQVKLPTAGQCPICFMDLIPLEDDSNDDEGPRVLGMSESARKLAQIVTAPVERRFADASIQLVGQIQYDERLVANISSWIPGRLDKLYVDFTGVEVRAGDPMVLIYSPQLLAAQEELLQAIKIAESVAQSNLKTIRETAQATIRSARDKLRLWGLTDTQISEIEARGTPSDQITIHAPIGGVVVAKPALEGQYVQTGTHIYTIADLSEVWLDLEAYESDLHWLRLGQTILFSAEAFPGESFDGRIAFIDPFLNTHTRTVRVRANVTNTDRRLKPGMFARATVTAGVSNGRSAQTAKAPLIIPASAPLITGKRAVVYVVVPDRDRPTFEGRDVVLGPRAGDYYIVASGLFEGEMVVVNGAFKIDSELQIRAKPSMMSPEGGIPMIHNHGAPAMGTKAAKTAKAPPPEKRGRIEGLPHGFAGELTPVYDAYFHLHAALADDKQPAALAAVEELHQRITVIDAGSLGEPAEDAWQRVSTRLADATALDSDDSDWDGLRTGFEDIAAAMIDLDYYFGHPDTGAFFVTFCPMAFNNRGAYWLQKTKAITNPYFGHKMLKCGSVTDEIQPVHEH